MKATVVTWVVIAGAILALLVVSGAFYVVGETEQAILTEFGKPIGSPITAAGVHFKIPFVQSVLVFEKRILTSGFNGSPAGQAHCDEIGHLLVDGHCVRTIHAETNAIIQAALHGVSTKDATCYVTHLPCLQCTKALINAGISRIVYSVAYRVDENAINFLRAADIEVTQKEFTAFA